MKNFKLGICSSLLLPIVAAPVGLSSCAVFKDLTKGFDPTYSKLEKQNLTTTDAINKWIARAKDDSNFIKDECFWTHGLAAKIVDEGSIEEIPGVTYKSTFTVYSINFNYCKVTNVEQHRLSLKFTAEIEQKDEYKYKNEYSGYGITHYTVEWEAKELEYDFCKEDYPDIREKYFWLIKPKKYVWDPVKKDFYWNENLSGDERIAFNTRFLVEIYNSDGIQAYGFEATEAAIMDKEISYVPQLGYIMDQLCCWWSYYLDDCNIIE